MFYEPAARNIAPKSSWRMALCKAILPRKLQPTNKGPVKYETNLSFAKIWYFKNKHVYIYIKVV